MKKKKKRWETRNRKKKNCKKNRDLIVAKLRNCSKVESEKNSFQITDKKYIIVTKQKRRRLKENEIVTYIQRLFLFQSRKARAMRFFLHPDSFYSLFEQKKVKKPSQHQLNSQTKRIGGKKKIRKNRSKKKTIESKIVYSYTHKYQTMFEISFRMDRPRSRNLKKKKTG